MAFDKNKYDQQFHKENYTRLMVKFRNTSDADVIQKLQEVPNKADYIRQLIRQDLKKE